MKLVNGTEYFLGPAIANAIRGLELLKYAFWDEAAHIAELDDSEYYSAIVGRLANADGYSRYVSTSKGSRGFFWRRILKLTQRPEPSGNSRKMKIPYYLALGELISQKYIDESRLRLGPFLLPRVPVSIHIRHLCPRS